MSREKIKTEMVTFRAPEGTRQVADARAQREGYKDRSALLVALIYPNGVSGETRVVEAGNAEAGTSADGVAAPPRPQSPIALTHAHAVNCPCSICRATG